jgi:hypothetical protein
MDLSKLTDEEIELLERLLLKAAGEFVGDVTPPFRIEFVDRVESNAAADVLRGLFFNHVRGQP